MRTGRKVFSMHVRFICDSSHVQGEFEWKNISTDTTMGKK